MGTGRFATTSLASMLEATSREAELRVAAGVRRLRRIIKGRIDRPAQLPLYLYVAIRQLYSTYLALTHEVTQLGTFDSSISTALARLARAQMVQRVHRSGGDFALIGRICQALHPHEEDPRVSEVKEVLLSWTNREAHLFSVLVPLANYADELRREVTQLRSGGADGSGDPTTPASLAARLKEAGRDMAPARRHLGQATLLLHQLAEELKPLTTASPSPSPQTSSLRPSSQETTVLGDTQATYSSRTTHIPKEIAS